MKLLKDVTSYIIAALCLVLFCSVPIIYSVFPLNVLPVTFIGAAMGAVITVVITHFLLKKQSDAQEVKECNVKIFEKKSQLFQNFIDQVWKIWTNEKITCDDYAELTSQYYKNLMIYIKIPEKLEVIGKAISKLGNCLEAESFENSQELKLNIIEIINTLSGELGLGGTIDEKQKEQIWDHDYILFLVKFRKAMQESFNKIFVFSFPDIFKKGQWIQWKEGNNIIHDDLVFDFKEYPGCSIRFGFAKDAKGKCNEHFIFIFFVPVGANYHEFDKYRDSVGGLHNKRIRIRGYKNLFQAPSQDDENIPSFNFDDKEKVIGIRKDFSYSEIADTLAQRAKEIFKNITVEGENLSVVEFLKKHWVIK